jgi:antitoxin ParD1/3/4
MPTKMRQLNISITPYFSRFIQKRVKSGRYSDASEVVRKALRRLDQDEMLQEQAIIADPDNLYEELLKAHESSERGENITLEGDEEVNAFFEDIVTRGKQRLAARKKTRKR